MKTSSKMDWMQKITPRVKFPGLASSIQVKTWENQCLIHFFLNVFIWLWSHRIFTFCPVWDEGFGVFWCTNKVVWRHDQVAALDRKSSISCNAGWLLCHEYASNMLALNKSQKSGPQSSIESNAFITGPGRYRKVEEKKSNTFCQLCRS